MNFLLMYFKIPYDFTILRSVFTIRVCIAFSVPCQNRDFNNLDLYRSLRPYFEPNRRHGFKTTEKTKQTC